LKKKPGAPSFFFTFRRKGHVYAPGKAIFKIPLRFTVAQKH
jgi:hypothetical protein